MRRLAYVHDHRYLRSGTDVYSTGTMGRAVWSRFLGAFDEITVFASVSDAKGTDVEKLSLSSCPRVRFVHVPYVSTITRFSTIHTVGDKTLKTELPKFDAVIVRLPGHSALNAVKIAKRHGIPVGAEVVGCPFDAYWNYGGLAGKALAPLMYFLLRRNIKKVTDIVYVTEFFLQKRYPSDARQTNISNVNIHAIPEHLHEEKVRERQRRKPPLVLGLMGSMGVRYKGHSELLKALAIAKNDMPNFRVELVGPGDFQWVIRLAETLGVEGNLKVLGKLAADDVIAWLDTIDIYVHPSRQEGLPRSVIEAMSRGCPVLASSVGGIPELLHKDYLHRPGDYRTLAMHLVWIGSDSEQLVRMSKENLNRSMQYASALLSERRANFWEQFALSLHDR